jgi:hypothetical protein
MLARRADAFLTDNQIYLLALEGAKNNLLFLSFAAGLKRQVPTSILKVSRKPRPRHNIGGVKSSLNNKSDS